MIKKKSLIERMRKLFKKMRSLADFQISFVLKESGNSVRPCRLKLLEDGIISKSDRQIINKKGRKCFVYEYISKGKNESIENKRKQII